MYHLKYLYIVGSVVGAVVGGISSFATHYIGNFNTVKSMSLVMIKVGYILSITSAVVGALIGLIVALVVHRIIKLQKLPKN
ncbi:MAG: hypothetical protein M0P97_01165 [Candidatus Moranbacteria bacterium]|jgi:NO-binding membrane sensor protein with MHYT domain|nr:hypothetical protein [Candidatus Moranbacteria bacterium]